MRGQEPLFLISEHAHVCFSQGYAVFLDVARDKYTALDLRDARTLSGTIEGWPFPPPSPDEWGHSFRSRGLRIIQELLHEGVITDGASPGKSACPATLPEATIDLRTTLRDVSIVDPWHFLQFSIAWANVTISLRVRPFRYHIERMRRRKSTSLDTDPAAIKPLLASYLRLQPRFFSAHDACLRDSFTLIEFLARHRVFPLCVFGVRMEPFAAHCWVQAGSVLLNDTVEHVGTYTPILVV